MDVVCTDGLWGQRRVPQGLLSTPGLSWGPTLTPVGLFRVMPMRCLEQDVAHVWHWCAKGVEDSTWLVQVVWIRCCLEMRNMDN